MRRSLAFYFCLFALALLSACAHPGVLTGGDKDATPPRLSKERSTPNFQTNFKKQPLEFEFDEFILLDKADQQVLISPPLEFRPKISIKDKTVLFKFDDSEVLKENTTYVINFGESVKDYTEGNIVPDFQFVFSTSSVVDSLQLSAKVYNADEAKPAEKTVLMLYSDLSDSAVYKSKPDYAARTDKSGDVTLKYLKAGTYQVVALKDENLNYKYDLTNEKAGFVREPITLPYSGEPLAISIFAKEPAVRITSIDSSSNQRIRLIMEPASAGVTVERLDKNDGTVIEINSKSIDIYYGDTLRKAAFIVARPGFKADTIQHQLSKKIGNRKFRIAEEQPDIKPLPFTPDKDVVIRFNTRVKNLDSDLIQLIKTGSKTPVPFNISADSANARFLNVSSKWISDTAYTMIFAPNAILDYVGNTNDSMNVNFKITDPATLGSISLMIDSLNANYDYSIQLAKGNELLQKWIVKGQTTFKTEINGLPADTYQINILEDRNKNGKIDKGSFEKKELPENIYTKKLEQLRQNWSIDVVINMSEFQN